MDFFLKKKKQNQLTIHISSSLKWTFPPTSKSEENSSWGGTWLVHGFKPTTPKTEGKTQGELV